jgi:hypothetical protein
VAVRARCRAALPDRPAGSSPLHAWEEAFDRVHHRGTASGDGRVRSLFGGDGTDLGLSGPCGGDLVDQGEDIDRVPGGGQLSGLLSLPELVELAGDGRPRGIGAGVGTVQVTPVPESMVAWLPTFLSVLSSKLGRGRR